MTERGPGELFKAPFVDSWRDDETLFSLASRQHLIGCKTLASDTCLALFGHARHGCAHDLPSCIDGFVERTGGALGNAESIIRRRTLLPFYLPFRSKSAGRNALAAMRGTGIGPLKAQLGMLATRFRAHHPLKACPHCMAEDRKIGGVAYWRRVHQLPSSWVCLQHGEPLLQSHLKTSGVGRFSWHLPELASLGPATGLPPADIPPIWHELALCGEQVISLPKGFHFNFTQLALTYRCAAAANGLLSSNDRLNVSKFGDMFADMLQPLRAIPDLSALPGCPSEAVAQFARMLKPPRTGAHPLRHFAVILVLFGGWDRFWKAYCSSPLPSSAVIHPGVAPNDLQATDTHDRKSALLTLIAEGRSMAASAEAVGIAVGTAMAWAAQAGISSARRPKLLKAEVRSQLIAALRRGADKQAVAASLGLSVQTITTTLRVEPGLLETWRSARFARSRRKARSDWIATTNRHPRSTQTQIRQLSPATFTWLYRHDRAWLNERGKRQPSAPKSNHSRLDWGARDENLAREIESISLSLARQHATQRITVGMVCHALPALKPLLGSLDRLPLSSKALKQATRRRKPQAEGQFDF